MKLLFRRFIMIIALLPAALALSVAAQYYVSTAGNDTNSGTIDLPFATISKALSLISPGDTIFVRGGTYIISNTSYVIKISSSKNGIDTTRRSCLFGYPGERPILDFSSMGTPRVSANNDGIRISGKYWYVKNLDIKGAQHNGIALNGGSYNIVENCAMYENRNSGLQIDNGASYNRIINCDSYYNRDSTSASDYDGNADGFAPKLQNGTLNYFYGCRSWQNSDDGWDGYVRPALPVAGKDTMKTIIENCWCFSNGYLKNGNAGTGNGNGFKMGGGDKSPTTGASNGDSLRHNMTLINCLSFNNRVKGFDQNNNRGTMTLINCTGYANGTYNFSVSGFIRTGESLTVKNCISLVSSGVTLSGVPYPILATDSWLAPFSGAASTDFISTDTAGVRGPRKPDGSLPDITFMHLASNSQFVNRGTDVGLPYIGTAPDLGCFESSVLTGIAGQTGSSIPQTFNLSQNYPNPFNPSTEIQYSVPAVSVVKLSIYDILGQEVTTLVNEQMQPGNYSMQWNASRMSSGLYFIRLYSQSAAGRPFLQTRKMLLAK
jgi:hypothetical protein